MLTQQDKVIVRNFLQNLARQSQEDAILDFIDGKIIKTKLEIADKLQNIMDDDYIKWENYSPRSWNNVKNLVIELKRLD